MTAIAQFPVNLVIPITSEDDYLAVEKLITEATENHAFLSKAYFDEQVDESQRARLMINGEEVKRGTVEQMKEAYKLQAGISLKTNIAVQEWQKPVSGPAKFVTILSRAVRVC
jgi:hypothetical protein